MLYETYFIKHYYLLLKENNFPLMSQNRHPSATGACIGEATTTSERREERSSYLILPNFASVDDAAVCSRLNSLSDYGL